jgi:hypothetical protein
MDNRTIFVSYSRKDEKWRQQIVKGLNKGGLAADYVLWDDWHIRYGDEWWQSINEALGTARVALLLVSPDYLAAEFITNVEVPRLLELRERNGLRIIPIIVRPCNWMEVPWISRLLVAPRSGKPLSELHARQVGKELKEVAAAISSNFAQPAEPQPSHTPTVRPDAGEALPRPVPPPELVEACLANECILYAGGGLSSHVGLPLWKGFLSGMVEWASENNFIAPDTAQSYRAALAQGRLVAVSDGLMSDMEGHQEALHRYLASIYGRASQLSDRHSLLKRIPFSAVLTTNLDTLIEQTYKGLGAQVYTPHDGEALYGALSKREFFILKLYGTLERPDTVILAETQYTDTIRENLPFAQFIESLFFSRTLLFVGVSLDGIENYLRAISPVKITNRRRHFALVAVSGNAWLAQAASLERRYGIAVLPFMLSPDFAEVSDFLRALGDQVQPARAEVGSAAAALAAEKDILSESYGGLKKVVLQNIGPFNNLELTLDPRWNIILGDNGVGKSNILKAIAVGLCGKDAQPFAERLVKWDKPSGLIVLETERHTFKTEIFRNNGEAELISNPPRPLEIEGGLAVGFPPLRTVSWSRSKGPEPLLRLRAAPEDLLPIVRGEPDPRLDKLKQWIVNIDYRSKDEKARTSGSKAKRQIGRYELLLLNFFRIVDQLIENLTVKFKEVNAETNEVMIITDDGTVPFEAISQGTTSLVGWIGIILQRLHEIYDYELDPTRRYALVLIDEIDAHLHPTWQQSLIYNLKKVFPNMQFIATTHSPLIVGGMPAAQVMRLARDDDGKIVQVQVEQEMMLGRADQILTGELFGMHTTIDRFTREDKERYTHLLGKKKRTEEEEREFQRLSQVIEFPPSRLRRPLSSRRNSSSTRCCSNRSASSLAARSRMPARRL